MTSDILEKPSPQTRQDPIDAALALPAGRWELSMRFSFSFGEMTGRAVLDLLSADGLVSGTTALQLRSADKTIPPWPADFDGQISAAETELNLWINEPLLKHTHFICRGERAADGERYDGQWEMPCMDPSGCACDGDSGNFSLIRITPGAPPA